MSERLDQIKGQIKGQKKRPNKRPKMVSKTNCCPTQGCNGSGNRNPRYFSHKSVKSCPLSVGQILNVSLGRRRKSDKVIYKTMTVSETPVVEGFDNRWHYYVMVCGEGSAHLKLFHNNTNIVADSDPRVVAEDQ